MFIFIIYKNRTVLVPTLSINNNDVVNICIWSIFKTEGTSLETSNFYYI